MSTMLAEEFGFWGGLDQMSYLDIEELPDGRHALQLIQLYEKPTNPGESNL